MSWDQSPKSGNAPGFWASGILAALPEQISNGHLRETSDGRFGHHFEHPADVNTLRNSGAPRERQLDSAFSNLVNYARKNLSYSASGKEGGEALLAGTATSVPCGGIATALKLVFINGLGVPDKEVEYIRITGYLWTGPTYLCFDPKVKGNLRKLETPGQYGNGCIFNEHYYLQCDGKYYDPCLSASYAMRDQSIKLRFSGKDTQFSLGNSKLLVTPDKSTGMLYLPNEPVPGFQGSWAMFALSKKNLEKAMGSQLFKTEMKIRNGTTEFARFVSTLI